MARVTLLHGARPREVRLVRQPRRRPEQLARLLEQLLKRVNEMLHDLLLRKRIHEREPKCMRLLGARPAYALLDVSFQSNERMTG